MPLSEYQSSRLPVHLRARNTLRQLAVDATFWGWHRERERQRMQERGDFSNFLTRPGALIERQPDETREMLQHLRSEDFQQDKPLDCVARLHWNPRSRVYKIPGTCPGRQG